jgi:polysaccharide biosynthesis/export protein
MKFRMLLNLLWVLLAGVCGANAQLPMPTLPLTQPAPLMPAPVVATPQAAPAPAPGLLNGYVPDDTHKLRAGDTVSFQILEDRIWNPQSAPVSLVVADSGELDVPYIGRVMAADKTCKQVAAQIKTALEKDYYKVATVVVSLNVANRIIGRVYIWGQVRNQGALDLQINENLTAGKAILRAGGFADFANKRKVKVVRTDADGKTQTFELDMQQILEEGKVNEDIVLQPNDLIIVPSRLVNF